MINETNDHGVFHFCPQCGYSLLDPKSLTIEYWSAEKSIHFCWCHRCGWKGEIVSIGRFSASEPEESQ